MDSARMLLDKETLLQEAHFYLSILLQEFKNKISSEQQKRIQRLIQSQDIIQFSDQETISLVTENDQILLPRSAYQVIEMLSFNPQYGKNRNHKLEEGIVNSNTFYDYIDHVIQCGFSPLQYFEEILLHECVHLFGCISSSSSSLGYALMEGMTELKTREIAQKYGLCTSFCGYPKEVQIASILQGTLGKDLIEEVMFSSVGETSINGLDKKKTALLRQVKEEMDPSFRTYRTEISSIMDPLQKAKCYDQIDYRKVDTMLQELQEDFCIQR